jgi:hypothetical protein
MRAAVANSNIIRWIVPFQSNRGCRRITTDSIAAAAIQWPTARLTFFGQKVDEKRHLRFFRFKDAASTD